MISRGADSFASFGPPIITVPEAEKGSLTIGDETRSPRPLSIGPERGDKRPRALKAAIRKMGLSTRKWPEIKPNPR